MKKILVRALLFGIVGLAWPRVSHYHGQPGYWTRDSYGEPIFCAKSGECEIPTVGVGK